MKRLFLILTFCLLIAAGARADATAQKTAINAQEKYDTRHFAQSAKSYERILQDGLYSPEIFFNLGNAYFKSGDLPRALLNYRRAWYFIPGDPDLEANMKLAAETAGVVLPEESFLGRIAFSLSQGHWVNCAQVGYLLTTVLIVAAIAVSRGRNGLLKAALLPLLVALVSCLGIWKWHQLYKDNEQVILSPVAAKYGPTETSTDHFKTPAGSVVRARKAPAKSWRQINLNHNIGWVKKDACAQIVIWKY